MNKINEYSFHTKDDMLNKLRAYTHNPDDDNIRIKNQVYQILLHCPELLYAIHDAELESELFDDDGNLNVDADWVSGIVILVKMPISVHTYFSQKQKQILGIMYVIKQVLAT